MATLEIRKAENAFLSDEVVNLKGKLLTTEAAKEQLKLDTDKRIVELTKQIELLKVRLASMDKAKDSQEEEMDTNEDVNEAEDELKQLNFLAALKSNDSGTLLPPPGWRDEMEVEGSFCVTIVATRQIVAVILINICCLLICRRSLRNVIAVKKYFLKIVLSGNTS